MNDEAKMLAMNDQVKELVHIAALVNSSLDPVIIRERSIEAACRLVDAERASLLLRDEKTEELYFEVATGEKSDRLRRTRLAKGEGVAGWVATNCEPTIVEDVAADSRHASGIDDLAEFETRNMLCVPVMSRGNLVGVLEVMNKREGCFGPEEKDLLTALADQVAIAIENAKLYSTLRRRLVENWIIAVVSLFIVLVTVFVRVS